MIDRYLYGDILESVRKKCYKTHGGTNFFGFIKLNQKAEEECQRVMKLSIGEIYEFLKD